MANISDATGEITLHRESGSKGWTKEDLDFVNWLFGITDGWYYGIHIEREFDEQVRSVGFNADGRWTFEPMKMDGWMQDSHEDEETREKYQEGIKGLYERDLYIRFDYVDVEPGFRYLSSNTATLKPEKCAGHYYLYSDAEEEYHQEYDFEWDNFRMLNVADSDLYEEICDFVESWLKDQQEAYKESDKGNQAIERWVDDFVSPTTFSVDEQVRELLEEYGDELLAALPRDGEQKPGKPMIYEMQITQTITYVMKREIEAISATEACSKMYEQIEEEDLSELYANQTDPQPPYEVRVLGEREV